MTLWEGGEIGGVSYLPVASSLRQCILCKVTTHADDGAESAEWSVTSSDRQIGRVRGSTQWCCIFYLFMTGFLFPCIFIMCDWIMANHISVLLCIWVSGV